MSTCRFHPSATSASYCPKCRAFLCVTCTKPGRKTCPLCRNGLVAAEEAPSSERSRRDFCPNHPHTTMVRPCHGCNERVCSECLNWESLCTACSASKTAQVAGPSEAELVEQQVKRYRKSTPEPNRFRKGTRMQLARWTIGAVVGGVFFAWLSFNYTVFKDFATKAGKTRQQNLENVQAYKKSAQDYQSALDRVERGEVTDADVAEVEALMTRIERGEAVDPQSRRYAQKVARVKQLGDPKTWATLSQWSNDEPQSLSMPRFESKPLPTVAPRTWKVGIANLRPGGEVRGAMTVKASITAGSPIERVEFHVNGQWQGLSNRAPYRFDWDTQANANGPATVQVVAYDMTGKAHASRKIRVTVAN